ncbi:protein phosphatase 1 regulatory subunit 3A, partial [Silurus meridionalis]
NLLGLPEPCSLDSDDEQLDLGGIKPKSSPIPRRRSSLSCSDDDSQPPPSSSRRVSFADAFGLSLVSVKQFNTRSMCDPAESLEVEFKDSKEYYLKVLFALPLTLEELLYRVQEQKVDLESLELMPGTTTLKGSVRVLNLCFDKLVYIRTSLDCWSSHFDLLAEYVSESSQGLTDCFSFKLTMVPPFGERGARVDFCIRYETPFGTFWANNGGQNYVVFCHEKAKEQDENEKLVPKSCLK